ncbi:hypothetical protein GCM10022380_31360 [Amycolatopsis tucumanensis]|uniref:Uncharacterized protein n=1 Tax=Amycolatopsis tucumanensis TaxID=401106 RepID=A0ABP7I677_9PSEU
MPRGGCGDLEVTDARHAEVGLQWLRGGRDAGDLGEERGRQDGRARRRITGTAGEGGPGTLRVIVPGR